MKSADSLIPLKVYLGCDDMDIFAVAIFAIVACVLSVVIKQYNPEFSLLITILAGTLIFVYIISDFTSIFTQVETILGFTGQSEENIKLLLKALGVCFITQLAFDTCQDSGQSAIASKVELTGKLTILVLALPLFTQLVGLLTEIIYR